MSVSLIIRKIFYKLTWFIIHPIERILMHLSKIRLLSAGRVKGFNLEVIRAAKEMEWSERPGN